MTEQQEREALPPLPQTSYVLGREARPYEPEYLSNEPGYDADQMHTHYRKGYEAGRAATKAEATPKRWQSLVEQGLHQAHALTNPPPAPAPQLVQDLPPLPATLHCESDDDGNFFRLYTADQMHAYARAALAATPAPVQQPLTDEQIDKLPWGPHEGSPVTFAEGLRDFARAIEAAHNIKEQP